MKVINGIKLFSSQEIAELLGTTERTLSNLRRKGLLRCVRIGRNTYLSEESLNDYLNGRTQTATKADNTQG